MADTRNEEISEPTTDARRVTEPMEEAKVETDPTNNAEAVTESSEAKPKECPKFLDLAFAMDCTGSMGSYIHSAQQNIRKIVEQIVSEEKADVRLALVEYRDHPPQDSSFVTKVHDFTSSVRSMKQWLDGCSAQGGGDQAEAVADALHQVLKLSWRDEATKVCVFIADAPPHGIGCGSDGFPKGCPDGLDPMEITNQLTAKHISLYMVGCEPSIVPFRDFFMGLSHLTGGQYVPLAAAHLLINVITGGVMEEMSLQQIMQDVNQEVMAEFGGREGEIEEEELTKHIHEKLKVKGTRARQLQRNQADLPEANVRAQQLSKCTNMAAARDMYGTSEATSSRHARHSRGPPPPSSASSGGGGGITGFFGRMMGRSAAPPPPAPGARAPEMNCMEFAPTPMTASMEPTPDVATSGDIYGCVEDEVSEAQVQRMVQKSVWSNNLKGRYNKKH